MKTKLPCTKEHEAANKRDAELVKKTLNNDDSAFAQLMALYKKRVEAMGMSFFKNSIDTEDFVQDVFIKVFTKLNTFRFESMFSTWLTRIAYTTAVNAVNRRKEYLSIADENSLEDKDSTPEEQQIKKLTKEAVRLAIKELPTNYVVCLDMYFFYDISYSQISEITGFPINTIKSYIFRAKKILKEKIIEKELI